MLSVLPDLQDELEKFASFHTDGIHSRAYQDARELLILVIHHDIHLAKLSIDQLAGSFSLSWPKVYVNIPFVLDTDDQRCFYLHYIPSRMRVDEEFSKVVSAEDAIKKVLEYTKQ